MINNTAYHVRHRLAICMRRILMGDTQAQYKAGRKFLGYLSMSPREFRLFVRKRLQPEFTLANYGRVWVLDHIAPIFLFDQTSEDDLQLCWNFINVIPMPHMLNRLKGVSIDFAIKELEIRSLEFPDNPVVDKLKERVTDFVRSLEKYHSKPVL